MEKNTYESKSIRALIVTFSIPTILSLVVEIMTSVVDTVFAGHLGAASVNALTAMGLLSPVLSIFTAFQALYAVSTAILIARHLNNKEERNGYFSTGVLFTILVSLVVSVLSFWGMDNILQLLGAEREVFDLAKKYLQIQLVSNIFSAMGYTLTSCIRAFGYPKMEMVITTLAVGVNIAANAIFAFGFQMGFTGLALGTLASEMICMLLAVCWILKKGFFPSFRYLHCTTLCCRAWELFRLGFVQTVIQALAGCTGFFVNNSLMLHATLNHVAIWNIVQKIYILLLMPVVGITQGIQTVIAYYSGHKQETKKQKTIRLTIFYTVLYGCIGTVFVFLFGNKILSIFGSSDAMLAQSTAVLKIIFLTFPVVGIFYTILTLLEVTEHEIKAVILTLLRQVFLLLPLVYLLPNLFPQLKNAVFWAVPISDLLILFLAIIMKAIAFENSKDNRASQR